MVIPSDIFTKKHTRQCHLEVHPSDICSNYDFNDEDVNLMFQMKSGDIRLTLNSQAVNEIGIVRQIEPPKFDKDGKEI